MGQTLFFAGEATHPAVNPCMQARFDFHKCMEPLRYASNFLVSLVFAGEATHSAIDPLHAGALLVRE